MYFKISLGLYNIKTTSLIKLAILLIYSMYFLIELMETLKLVYPVIFNNFLMFDKLSHHNLGMKTMLNSCMNDL